MTLFTLPNGLFGVRLDDGVELVGDGNGMTATEAEGWLDRIEQANHVPSADPLLPRGRRLAGHL